MNDKPICDIDAERSALAVMMVRDDDNYEATASLSADSFYEEKHKTVFLAIKKLVSEGEKVDVMSVAVCLNSHFNGAVSFYELTKICDADTHMRLSTLVQVLENFRQRRKIQALAMKTLNEVPDCGFSLPDDVVRLADSMMEVVEGGAIEATTLANEMSSMLSPDDPVPPCVKTGINLIDRNGGLDLPSLSILGAYHGHGKTMLSANMAINAARMGAKVAYYSLEMTNRQLAERMLAAISGVPKDVIHKKSFSMEQRYDLEMVAESDGAVAANGIYFDFCREQSIEKIMLSIRRMKNKYGVSLVFIDHFLLINLPVGKFDNEERAQALAGRALFNLSRELGIAIVVLWQLNKKEGRSMAPVLSNLRGSGQPAEAADNIFLLFSPGGGYAGGSGFASGAAGSFAGGSAGSFAGGGSSAGSFAGAGSGGGSSAGSFAGSAGDAAFPEPFADITTFGYAYFQSAKCRNNATGAELLKVDATISLIRSLTPSDPAPAKRYTASDKNGDKGLPR